MEIGEGTGCVGIVKRRSRGVIAQFYSSLSSPGLEMDRLTGLSRSSEQKRGRGGYLQVKNRAGAVLGFRLWCWRRGPQMSAAARVYYPDNSPPVRLWAPLRQRFCRALVGLIWPNLELLRSSHLHFFNYGFVLCYPHFGRTTDGSLLTSPY